MATGAHRYDIILKQGDLRIELTSDDVYFIAKQMNKWFDILINDAYVAVTLPVRRKTTPARTAEASAPVAAAPRPAARSVDLPSRPVENSRPLREETSITPEPPPRQQPVERSVESPVEKQVEAPLPNIPSKTMIEEVVVPPAITLPDLPEPQPQPPVLPERVKDDFEAVMDTILEDLSQEEEEEAANTLTPSGFSVPKPTLQPAMAMVDSLPELYEKSQAKTAEDFLMLSAYYLTYIDGEERFSLKRVNALMIRSGYSPLTHTNLENVLTQGYLAMVPDLTGMADVTEYSLTPSGQAFANQLL